MIRIKKLTWLIIIGTIPAGFAGVVFKNIIEETFQSFGYSGIIFINHRDFIIYFTKN